jgi:ribonuclease PH
MHLLLQVTHGAHMLIDPTRSELDAADRHVLAIMDSPKNRVVHLEASGIFPATELANALELGADACTFYYEQIRATATSFGSAGSSAVQTA